MFTDENRSRLWSWLEVAMRDYTALVDNCVDLTVIFTKEKWIEQAVKIQVDFSKILFHYLNLFNCLEFYSDDHR